MSDDDNGSGSRPAWLAALAPLQKQWAGLAWREKQLVWAAGVLVTGALVWLIGLQPALRTLRDTPRQIDALELQLQQMRRLASEAQSLRGAAPVSVAQASLSLKAATDRLGSKARLALQGERATVTFTGVGSNALRDWFSEARAGARARPLEANLARGPQGFNGTVILSLGGNP